MASQTTIFDAAITDYFEQLSARLADLAPIAASLGEGVVARAKERFATSTAPDGSAWAPNTQATIERYIARRGGISKRTGKITKRGAALAMSKKPLIGEAGDLRRQIGYAVEAGTLTVFATPIYAAVQQFGAARGAAGSSARGPIPWGDIPARPFLPVTDEGDLYSGEREVLLAELDGWLGSLA